MHTVYEMEEQAAALFLNTARNHKITCQARPSHFAAIMRQNTGMVGELLPWGQDTDGLERRNPLIVAIGDSVTAGHFENLQPLDRPFDKKRPIEIADPREVYHEKFRLKLIDTYEQTSVSVLNAGIAGDTIFGMEQRLKRDVLSHSPDLVLLNGTINWRPDKTTADFRDSLLRMTDAIRSQTQADLILMTPNPVIWSDRDMQRLFRERIECVRDLSVKQNICLADIYAIWEEFLTSGYPLRKMLSNKTSHPTKTGHEVCALELINLVLEA
ncbi:SGNH/GDSL hydrolase family protein [Diplocloster agilis]|uniref:SGNH/GDSL hydrolase family protein n=1 Tax=Diplocloster agilis TaxID=2850323 RepID=UPI000822A9C4|nr:SGNH/GDSL hydrolase family protein [Suonthocola fibrivorans]MCU6735724.1 SGNH/GDSL hydrolase family protein [Suonthocola fibrivorans]SCJ80447.1 GDSL-like Lipase/Acylhydrolase [uncultured Clostridium sp.]